MPPSKRKAYTRNPGRTETVQCPELKAAFKADPWLSGNHEAMQALAEQTGRTIVQVKSYWTRQRSQQGLVNERRTRKRKTTKPKRTKKKIESDNEDLTEISEADDDSSDDEPLAKRVKAINDSIQRSGGSSSSLSSLEPSPIRSPFDNDASNTSKPFNIPASPVSPTRRNDLPYLSTLATYSPTLSDFDQLVQPDSPGKLAYTASPKRLTNIFNNLASSSPFRATVDTIPKQNEEEEQEEITEEQFFVEINLGIRKLDKLTPESRNFSKEMQTWISEQVGIPKSPIENARPAPGLAEITKELHHKRLFDNASHYHDILSSPTPVYDTGIIQPHYPAVGNDPRHSSIFPAYEISSVYPPTRMSRSTSAASSMAFTSHTILGSPIKIGQPFLLRPSFTHQTSAGYSTPGIEEPHLTYFDHPYSSRESSVESLNPYSTSHYPHFIPIQTPKSFRSLVDPSNFSWVIDESPTGSKPGTGMY